MSGYVNPVFRPDFTDYPAAPQNRLAQFNAIWPASNPVGTETTQGMQSATPTDQIAFMRPDGTPVMQSDLQRAHEQVQTAMQVAPTMVLGMMGTTDPAGIRAFHASPYDFERFDTSKIGTGQGAQSFGHGLYTAESPAVSGGGGQYDLEFTAKNLGKPDLNQQESSILMGLRAGKSDLDLLRDQARMGASFEEAQAAIDRVKAAKANIYEVNIGADPEQFLHWDQTVGTHPPAVRDKLLDMGYGDADRGADVYSHMARGKEGDAGASQRLLDAGIPGIRYLDQGSRAGGQGTHNTVVFDANTIDILRKYGLAGLGVGLGAAAAGTQQQSQ